MRYVTPALGLFFVSMISLFTVSATSRGVPQEKRVPVAAEKKARDVVRRFLSQEATHLRPEKSASTQGLSEQGVSCEGIITFNVHNGRVITMQAPTWDAAVSLDHEAVIFFESRPDRPDPPWWIPGASRSASPRSGAAEREYPVKVTEAEAMNTALSLVTHEFGPEGLHQLVMADTHHAPRALGFYGFGWATKLDRDNVRWGICDVSVKVNAATGRVIDYARHGALIEKSPAISPARARELASIFLDAAGFKANIESLAYFEPRLRSGGKLQIWAIRYEREVIGPVHSIDDLFIDGTSGEVVPDPALIDDPQMEKILHQQREEIRKVLERLRVTGLPRNGPPEKEP